MIWGFVILRSLKYILTSALYQSINAYLKISHPSVNTHISIPHASNLISCKNCLISTDMQYLRQFISSHLAHEARCC